MWLSFFIRKGLYLLAITFSFDTFGYRYTFEVANDLSDVEALLIAMILRKNLLKYVEGQADCFPMFFNIAKEMQLEGYANLGSRIKLITLVYFSKWE